MDGGGGSGGGATRGSTAAISSCREDGGGGVLLDPIGRHDGPGSREEVEPMGERERSEWLMLSRWGGELSRPLALLCLGPVGGGLGP
jgi:hypothetical protein